MIVTLDEVRDWLRIDGNEEDRIIQRLIGAAERYLKRATEREFDSTDDEAWLFCVILIADWYENRELIGLRPSENVRFTVQSMLAQLQNDGGADGGV